MRKLLAFASVVGVWAASPAWGQDIQVVHTYPACDSLEALAEVIQIRRDYGIVVLEDQIQMSRHCTYMPITATEFERVSVQGQFSMRTIDSFDMIVRVYHWPGMPQQWVVRMDIVLAEASSGQDI